MIDLRGKKVLICEEALIDYKGHFYSWIKAIRKIHTDAGAEVMVAGNINMLPEIKAEFNATALYTENSWSGKYDSRSALKRYLNVFTHNYRLYRDTKQLLDKIGHIDFIILPATRIYHLLGWHQLISRMLKKKFDKILIFILTSEALYDPEFKKFYFKKSSTFIKTVLSWFKRNVETGSVIFAGDSHITCNEYETLSGVPFKVFPSPAAGLEATKLKGTHLANSDGTVTFVILGVAVIDKGIDILQQAIEKLLVQNSGLNARFIIQWAIKTIDYDGNEVKISNLLRESKQIELVEKVLSDIEYNHYMQAADFIVLPYRRLVYFNRLSGVAIEAACSGIPMIVTENTWLDWAMNEYGAGVTVKDGDPGSLAEQILYCITNSKELRSLALRQQQVALEKNSSEKYLHLMWG